MKLSEAIRIAEKIKPWVDRFPEYRAAIDTLLAVASTAPQDAEPVPTAPRREPSMLDKIVGETRKAWDEFAESVFDLPPCDTDPDARMFPERVDRPRITSEVQVREAVIDLVNRIDGPDLLHHFRTLATAWVPEPLTPAAPKPGDEVADRDAVRKLPHGTLIKDRTGMRGLVSPSSGDTTVVRWTDARPKPEYPVTIVDINVP